MIEIRNKRAGKEIVIEENPFSRFLFVSTKSAWIWLILRVYLGYIWLVSGIGKIGADAWTGDQAGVAIKGFANGALAKVADGDVSAWYGWFLENIVLNQATLFSYLVAYGEVLVGIGLIVGLLTGIAAFFGALMNFSFLLAGTISSNPMMFVIAILIIMAWKVAGWYGLDRWALPKMGTPWKAKH